MITFIEYNNIGAIADETRITVDAVGTSYTIPAGRKGVSFQNVSGDVCWYGGSAVDPTTHRGNKLFPRQGLVYKNVKNSFTIRFRCAAGESCYIGVVNHD